MEEKISILCAGCENVPYDGYTFYKGTCLCNYCIKDWLNEDKDDFHFRKWIMLQRIKMELDRNGN